MPGVPSFRRTVCCLHAHPGVCPRFCPQVYRNAKAALQKVLGVVPKATARDLCIQFGCARHDQSVRACLAAYKERFDRSLPEVQRGHVDFSRTVFLAAAFYLVARKNKVAVDRTKLLGPLGITATEFAQARLGHAAPPPGSSSHQTVPLGQLCGAWQLQSQEAVALPHAQPVPLRTYPPPAPCTIQVCASMSDLCHDLVGTEPRKRKAEELPEEQRALIERTGCAGAMGGGGDRWPACGAVLPVA